MSSIISKTTNLLPNIPLPALLPDGMVKKTYTGLVLIGAVYGGVKGFGRWLDWLDKRKKVALRNVPVIGADLVNPIINIGKDAGNLGYNVGMASLFSALMVATSPVSVPLFLFFSEEEKN